MKTPTADRVIRLICVVLIIFGGLFLLLIVAPILPLRATFLLAFGWVAFIQRTAPQVTANWSAIGFAALSSALILLLLHSFGAWLFHTSHDAKQSGTWKVRWTLSFFAALWLLFGFTMAATGVVHQVGWLVGSDAPLLTDRSRGIKTRLLSEGRQVQILTMSNDWNLTDIRAEIGEQLPDLIERFQLLLFPDERGGLAGFIVFPRAPSESVRTGFFAIDRKTATDREGAVQLTDIYPTADLPTWIARLNAASKTGDIR